MSILYNIRLFAYTSMLLKDLYMRYNEWIDSFIGFDRLKNRYKCMWLICQRSVIYVSISAWAGLFVSVPSYNNHNNRYNCNEAWVMIINLKNWSWSIIRNPRLISWCISWSFFISWPLVWCHPRFSIYKLVFD